VEIAAASQDIVIVTEVTFVGRYVADRTMPICAVVPVDELRYPALRQFSPEPTASVLDPYPRRAERSRIGPFLIDKFSFCDSGPQMNGV
jgi:hypothetical protein